MLITLRKKDGSLGFITQIGTGNYNESTAKLYTDLSLITANEEIAMNAQDVFKNLCMGSLVENSDILMVSPLDAQAVRIALYRSRNFNGKIRRAGRAYL